MTAPDKLSLVVLSDDRDRVHFALVAAAAALATGRRVTLFFTMDGTRVLTRGWTADDGGRRAAGIAEAEELLASCGELGGRFMVCETGLRAAGVTAADLRDDIAIEQGSVVTFLADATRHGAMLCV